MSASKAYIGSFIIALAGVLFWVLLVPDYDNIMAQREAIAERADIIQGRSEIIANIAALTKEYAKRSNEITRFGSIVPAKKSAAELVSSIQALTTQNGLQLTAIALSGGTIQDLNPYQQQSIDIGVTGTYLAFKSFLMGLERNIRLIDIISFDASPVSENSQTIIFRIKANAYYLKQQ